MIRVVVFLVLIGLAAFGAVWLADRPGDVAITWMGHRIETSVMVLAAAIAGAAAATTIFWALIRAIMRSPSLRRDLHTRRGTRGYHAVSQGLGGGRATLLPHADKEEAAASPDEPPRFFCARRRHS
jgi:HemY protein